MTDHGVPARSTTVRVIVKVLDENDNRPVFMEKVYKIKLPEREKVEKERSLRRDPVYHVIAADRDEGPNAEISYSIEEGDELGKFFIEPKTGLVSSKKSSSAGEYDILTVRRDYHPSTVHCVLHSSSESLFFTLVTNLVADISMNSFWYGAASSQVSDHHEEAS